MHVVYICIEGLIGACDVHMHRRSYRCCDVHMHRRSYM